MKKFLSKIQQKKEQGVNGLVIEIGLVIVGVVLLALFNNEIGIFFSETIADVTSKCQEILSGAVIN